MSAEKPLDGQWKVTTGISGDIYRALLGDRLRKPCGYTFELVDLGAPALRAQGVRLPLDWFPDLTWHARRSRVAA
jgi:hypothetical protein